ncbi:hypothetical protein SAMN05421780_11054 [Flexibacter flexilis DSM 6793]|uniref:Uncharacterized protein n=1 Tax=Flexibacter flexilis DSM 6793 TaxID=927664 RepID=A0A1I1M6E6_9BACT|nr:hypothetical protein [Flexibacter flexilis]SFC81067.1 hypothetical protein SAMN05421780_11054 [Flexibacter flexilis DSM 6793]
MLRLSEMSEDQKAKFYRFYDKKNGFLEPFENFNEFGLKFPLYYLQELGPMVLFFPLEIAAQYVDVATKSLIDDGMNFGILIDGGIRLGTLIDDIDLTDLEILQKLNATSCGNLAYIAMFSHHQVLRLEAEKQISALRNTVLSNMKKPEVIEAKDEIIAYVTDLNNGSLHPIVKQLMDYLESLSLSL